MVSISFSYDFVINSVDFVKFQNLLLINLNSYFLKENRDAINEDRSLSNK